MPNASPNYMTVASDGSTGAVFPGGITIPTIENSQTPPDARRIRWVRDSDGGLVAERYTYELQPGFFPSGQDYQYDRVYAHAPGYNAQRWDMATNASGSDMGILSSAGDSSGFIQARGLFSTATLWDSPNRYSDWAQTRNFKAISGLVSSGVNLWSGVNLQIDNGAQNGLIIAAQVSGYVTAAPALAQWNLNINGVFVATQGFFFNNAGVHHTLPWIVGKYNGALGAGTYTFTTTNPTSPLTVDFNDSCALVILG